MSSLRPDAGNQFGRGDDARATSGHRRQGDIAVIDRSVPLPDVCILTGVAATGRVRCLFHLQTGFVSGGPGPVEVLLEMARFYIQDVPKAMIQVPLSDALCRRRFWGWFFFVMIIVSAIGTILGLVLSQQWIETLPAGPQKKSLRTWLVPAIAFGGFVPLAVSAYLSDRLMPMPTRKLKVLAITDTEVWLEGASPEFLGRLGTIALPRS